MSSPVAVFRAKATALITGGASGVGLAVAKLCGSHNMNVILVDWDKSKLDKAKAAVKTEGYVEAHSIDVSSLADWEQLKKDVEKDGRKLDFLHLNAGIQIKTGWTDSSAFQKIFGVNFFGVTNGIHTFVPHFDNNKGDAKAIIVTGSKQGITNPPGNNPAYNATKSAVKTIAEHLSFDLAKSSPSTSVHLLVPGWTFTGITAGNLTEKPDGAWEPEKVADYLYKKMEDGKFYVICPDNDVDWETDRKRMTWTMGDVVFERQPQSRWRDEYKDEATKTMNNMKLGAKQAD